MCGIAGLLHTPSASQMDVTGLIKKMTNSLEHRGPDAEGIWIEGEIALGHRRLSILDPSEEGSQPMRSQCQSLMIIFNGEVYNHLSLRSDLERLGVNPSWRGRSDTETMLACIAHWGLAETLKRAKGMFAFALWDRARKKLFLVRDRMGEKPLYWGWAGKNLVFASEIKALRKHPDFPKGICRDALALYLKHSYVPAPFSIHPGIYKLEPGCVLEIDDVPQVSAPNEPLRPGNRYGPLSIWKYWSLNALLKTSSEKLIATDLSAIETLESGLIGAVDRQMISDVPLGAFLSGGIDSSLIVALMQQKSVAPIKTFTVGFENNSFNEAPYARAVAKHLGTDHSEIIVTNKEARAVIPNLPYFYDEPFADSSQIPTYLICKAAREQVTVSLSGDGGDELFGGYNRYVFAPKIWNNIEKMPMSLRKSLGVLLSAVPISYWDWFGGKIGGKLAVSHPGDKVQKIISALQEVDSIDDFYQSLISSWSLKKGEYPTSNAILFDPNNEFLQNLNLDPATRMMGYDLQGYLPDDILCKVDRASMSCSLETRAPFLDPDVLSVCARMPLSMKIRNGQGKWVLRQLLFKHVPKELIERPKTGFSIPLGDWLRGPLREWANDLLSQNLQEIDNLIDHSSVIEVWKEHLSGKRDWSQKLWVILMFQAWRAVQE